MRQLSRAGVALVFLLAVASGALYWIVSLLVHADEPFPVTILYRFGDTDYLSLFYAVSRFDFHEFITEGIEPRRLVAFPFGQSLFYAVPIMVFRDYGFVVGDLIVSAIRMAVCLAAGRIMFKDRMGAAAAAVVIFVMTGPLPLLSRYWELFWFPLWDMRNLRPFVTGVFALSLVLTTHGLMVRLRDKRPASGLDLVHGALVGLAVQGDLHLGITAAFVTAAIFVQRCLTSPGDFRRLAITALRVGIPCIVVLVPMLIQVSSVDLDVTRRIGQIPLSRLAPPLLISIGPWAELSSLLVLYGLIEWKKIGGAAAESGRRLILVAILFSAMCFLALPLSVIVLGRGVQIYHFPFRAFGFTMLGFVFAGLVLAQQLLAWLDQRGSRRLTAALVTVVVLVMAATHLLFLGYRSLQQARLDEQQRSWDDGWRPIQGYRHDLDDLWRELTRPEYRDRTVLATFDQQLGMLWTTRTGHHVWLPDPFLSSVSDQVIEHRLVAFTQLVGMTADQFDRHIEQEYFYNHLINGMKWQASRYYTFSPLSEYSPEEQAKIPRRYWSTIVPGDEHRRLDALFAQPTPIDGRLDLIVLTRAGDLGGLPGPLSGYTKVYENPTFIVWARQGS